MDSYNTKMTALMIGLSGKELNREEIKSLSHPVVCGVILFSRNYDNYYQLKSLINHIRSITGKNFLIAIDQEGGRVIRLSSPFSQLPAIAELNRADCSADLLDSHIHLHAWLMASELLSIGIDLSFAPVLDIDNGSQVIGDRAFSTVPNDVISFARTYCSAMHHAGMKTTAKHFPGHGTAHADSHYEAAVDNRPLTEIKTSDMLPFSQLIRENHLDAMMFSHVIYSDICSQAAGYSKIWSQEISRKQLGFAGIHISDDLNMKAAEYIGTLTQRYHSCTIAGMDIALVCTSTSATELLDTIKVEQKYRFPQLKGHSKLHSEIPFWEQKQWQTARKTFDEIYGI